MKKLLLVRWLSFLLITLGPGASAFADEATELAKRKTNPIADLASLSFDNGTSLGTVPFHSVQNELDIRPIVPFRLTQDWYLVTRTVLPVIKQPDKGASTGDVWGMGDITFTGFLATAKILGLTWGAGPVMTLPTATDDALGSGKWGLGPAAAATVSLGDWVFAFLVQNVWSVAGSNNRSDISQLLLKYSVSYNFPDGWYLTSTPTVTADWKAETDQRWVVPVGGGLGKVFANWRQPISIETQAFYNLERGAEGNDWSLSVQLQFLFPNF